MSIADNILQLMRLNGMTQSDLAKRIGIKRQTVSKWVNGMHPSGKMIPKIAKALGVDPSVLLDDKSDLDLELNAIILKMDDDTKRQLLVYARFLTEVQHETT